MRGACVLANWPGWLMLPSIAEYREYCTTRRFRHCPFFSGAGETPGLRKGHLGGPGTPGGAWLPPEVRGNLAA